MNTFYIGYESIETLEDFKKAISICSPSELKEIYGYLLRHCRKGLESESSFLERKNKLDRFLEEIRAKLCNKKVPCSGVWPDFLTKRGELAFKQAIEHGLIDRDSYMWIKSKAALSNWVRDVCLVDGCNRKLASDKAVSWQPFEQYFGCTHLASKEYNSDKNHTCKDYDKALSKALFPEIHKK